MKFRVKNDIWKEGENLTGKDVAIMLADIHIETQAILKKYYPELFEQEASP